MIDTSNIITTSFKKKIQENNLLKKELSFTCFENCIITPKIKMNELTISNGIYDQNGGVKYLTPFTKKEEIKQFPLELSINNNSDDDTVIFIGNFIRQWGHFLTDGLSLLWFLFSPLFNQFKGSKIICTRENNFSFSGPYLNLLSYLGIDADKIFFVDNPTIFKKIIVPDYSFRNDGRDVHFVTKDYINIINKIKSKFSNNNGKKLYLSWKYSSKGRSFGENKIEEFFKNRGFEIIYPEKESLENQLSLLCGCDVFASTIGSISHNTIFLKDTAKALLIPRGPFINGYQEILNCVNEKVDKIYIDSTLSILTKRGSEHSGPFFFFVSEELYRYFNEPIPNKKTYLKKQFFDFHKYFEKGVSLGRDEYSDNNSDFLNLWLKYWTKYFYNKNYLKIKILNRLGLYKGN